MAATKEDLAVAIEKTAPFLVACLRGGNEKVAQTCLGFVQEEFKIPNDPDALKKELEDSKNAGRIKELDAKVMTAMADGIAAKETLACQPQSDMDVINTDDYRSLKTMNIRVKWMLSACIVVGFFVVIIMQYVWPFLGKTTSDLLPQSKEQLSLLIGALIAAFTAVVQYFFGSSVGSAEKTLMMQSRDAPARQNLPAASNPTPTPTPSPSPTPSPTPTPNPTGTPTNPASNSTGS